MSEEKEKLSPFELDQKLIEAVEQDNIDEVSRLLEAGANPSTRPLDDCTEVLHIAVSNDSVKVVELLLNHGTDSAIDAFSLAVACDAINVSSFLFEKAFDINDYCSIFSFSSLVTPLIVAVAYNNLYWVEKLIENGADVNACTTDGTPVLCVLANSPDLTGNHWNNYMTRSAKVSGSQSLHYI